MTVYSTGERRFSEAEKTGAVRFQGFLFRARILLKQLTDIRFLKTGPFNEKENSMDKKVQEYVVEKTKELTAAHSCCREAREEAGKWLQALGTAGEKAETAAYIKELEEDITPIDGLIAFAESDAGKKIFGAENAAKMAAHAREIKAAGAKYCDCPACTAALAILSKKDEMLR